MNTLKENRTNADELGLLIYHLRQNPHYTGSKRVLAVSNYDTSAIIKAMQCDGKFVDRIPAKTSKIIFSDEVTRKFKNVPFGFKIYGLFITSCKAFNSRGIVVTPYPKLNDSIEALFNRGLINSSTKIIAMAYDNQINNGYKYAHQNIFYRLDGIITPQKGYKEFTKLPAPLSSVPRNIFSRQESSIPIGTAAKQELQNRI